MSIRVMSWVWDHADATGSELLILLAIADHADDDGGNAWPSIARLAKRTRVSPSTVQRKIKALEARGRLRVEPQRGGPADMRKDRRPNRYTIVMQRPLPDLDPAGCQDATPQDDTPSGIRTGCQNGRSRGVTAVTPEPSLQNRPEDQTHPSRTRDGQAALVVVPEPAKPKRRGKRPLPEDWMPTAQHAAIAAERGIDLAEQADQFRDYCAANGRQYADHDAAFRNWLRSDYQQPSGNGNGRVFLTAQEQRYQRERDVVGSTVAELAAAGVFRDR